MSEVKNTLPLPDALKTHLEKKTTPLLTQWSQHGKVPQSLLITGPQGCGKSSTAFLLSQTLMCLNNVFSKKSDPDEPASLFAPQETSNENRHCKSIHSCGECKSCLRFYKNQGIDLEVIRPENQDETKTGTIKVEQLRNLKTSLGHSAMESTYRIILIQNAETMTTQASNSLLKVLEEPPAGWIFILTTTDPSLLLQTIVSRCQNIKLPPLPLSVLSELLKNETFTEAQKQLALKLSQGNLKKMTSFQDETYFEDRKKITEFFHEPEKYFISLIDWAAKDNRNLIHLLDQLDFFCNDFIFYLTSNTQDSNTKIINEDCISLIQTLSKNTHGGLIDFFNIFEHQQEARSQINLPLNKKLFTENLLTPWLKILIPETQNKKRQMHL